MYDTGVLTPIIHFFRSLLEVITPFITSHNQEGAIL